MKILTKLLTSFKPKLELEDGDINPSVPIHIRIMAIPIKIVDYKKEYGCNNTINSSKGEIEKFNFCEGSKGQFTFGKSVLNTIYVGRTEYDCRWVHISDDWFKCVSKVGGDQEAQRRDIKLRKIKS